MQLEVFSMMLKKRFAMGLTADKSNHLHSPINFDKIYATDLLVHSYLANDRESVSLLQGDCSTYNFFHLN